MKIKRERRKENYTKGYPVAFEAKALLRDKRALTSIMQ